MPRSIILTVDAEATPEAVFSALSTRDGLASFWTPDVKGESAVGNRLAFGFAAAPVELEMTVAELVPYESIHWQCEGPWPYWEGTEVEWSIIAGEPTRVMLTQRGWGEQQPEVEFGAVAYTWGLVLGALRSFVETDVAAPALR
ncbi:MAG: SRPBCC domain-containing protein [Acidimicrobiia bacterium]